MGIEIRTSSGRQIYGSVRSWICRHTNSEKFEYVGLYLTKVAYKLLGGGTELEARSVPEVRTKGYVLKVRTHDTKLHTKCSGRSHHVFTMSAQYNKVIAEKQQLSKCYTYIRYSIIIK